MCTCKRSLQFRMSRKIHEQTLVAHKAACGWFHSKRLRRSDQRLASCAASDLLGARTNVGFCTFSIVQAIVAANPDQAQQLREGKDKVESADVARVVAKLAGVPEERLLMKDTERLLQLEKGLGSKVIGHKDVIDRLARVVRRNYAGFGSKRPMGSFLFLGPTGVGHGVAIPHGRIKGMKSPLAAVFRLSQPIGFDAPDEQPVCLLFFLQSQKSIVS